MEAVSVRALSKSYAKTMALRNLNFSVNPGELFAFIGPDGAGKTTLFRILTTLILADEGNVDVLGYDVVRDYKQIRNVIGYMPGKFSLYHDLSVEENLNFFASIFGTSIHENYDLVKDIYSQIEPFKKRKAGNLSGGMKQKLALSCSLIHKPELLILDEPTTGVDAVSRKEFWQMLKRLKSRGITIIVSTPYMDEAVQCERIALIQEGRILKIDTPKNISDQFDKKLYAINASNKYGLICALKEYRYTDSVYSFGEYLHYTDIRISFPITEMKKYLTDKGIENPEIIHINPGIEDTFIHLMKGRKNE